jgi:hypothetical protein
MSRYYSNYTTCLHCDDLVVIQQAMTNLLEQEGGCRISQLPPLEVSVEELTRNNTWYQICNFWIVGLFPGKGGWTIVKTWSSELLCHRIADDFRPRLSALAIQLRCDAFHLSVYGGTYGTCGILLEANAAGDIYVAGSFNADVPSESFYQQPIDEPDSIERFSLLKVPESFQTAMQINKAPEIIRNEEEYNRLKAEKHPNWSLLNELWSNEVSKGYTERIDMALEAILDRSGTWAYSHLAYAAYVHANELAAANGHLLYFQPPTNYKKPPAYTLTPDQQLEIFGVFSESQLDESVGLEAVDD